MLNLDVFNQDAFSVHSLTTAINKMPFVPGRIGRMGLFNPVPITTTHVDLEELDGVLTLLQTAERGAAPKPYVPTKRKLRSVRVPHIPHNTNIKADAIQDIRAFGQASQVQTVQNVVNQRLRAMATNHDVTLEHLFAGAVKGVILDADLSELLDLFSAFEVTQLAEVAFDLDNASPAKGALRKKCAALVRSIEDELGARPYEHIHALCSSQFFDSLVSHPEVEKAYERLNDGELLRTGLVRKTITIFDITFEEYRGKVGTTKFIADNKAHFFPAGSPGLFEVYYAPADYLETVNTLGLPRYAKQYVDRDLNKWVAVDTQSNPLPLCTIPRTLVQGKKGA